MKMSKTLNRVVGFTLIELMVVIAIVGILAAIAIPQYQTYTIRSSASQSLSAIRPFQLAVGEYAMVNQTVPTTANLTMLPGIQADDEPATCSGLVRRVAYTSAGSVPVLDDQGNATGETTTVATLTATFYGTQANNIAVRNAACGGDQVTVPAPLAGRTLVFQGNMNANGGVFWTIVPNGEEGGSTVPNRYFPNLQ